MPHLIGHQAFFSDCSPLDLIRLPSRGGFVWALAAVNAKGHLESAVLLSTNPKTPIQNLDGGLLVVNYGRHWRIEEDIRSQPFRASGTLGAGNILMRIAHKDQRTQTLVCSHGDDFRYFDIGSGHIVSEPGGFGIDATHWSVSLRMPDDEYQTIFEMR